MSANTLIAFGSSPDSYFIGHGRRHFVENMPEGFMNHAKTDLNIGMTTWISTNPATGCWVTHNVATGKFHFNANINETIRDHFTGANGKAAANFVSFPNCNDPGHFFVKGKNTGAWNAFLDNYFISKINIAKAELSDFDAGLTGMLFGKGKSHIMMFQTGFIANLDDDEVTTEEHPLYKVLAQYGSGWCIERGSSLCFYDSRFFYLKFKRPGQNEIKMHWNLPINMNEKLLELRQLAEQPAEKAALMQDEQAWTQVSLMRMNAEMQMTNMMANAIRRGGLGIQAAAYGGNAEVVERYY
ncbi:hypothetical protein MSAN_01908200 [Mycena sanguinolenta]|uniref:Uncharacterized protein n=1 Tax=Mycena sanguinolenta TaxID=230812 RepID=A0A8H6XRB7_9AGAR|nr:hypothetical protein MSAN_01908200 [Mycena sanguinolenta]